MAYSKNGYNKQLNPNAQPFSPSYGQHHILQFCIYQNHHYPSTMAVKRVVLPRRQNMGRSRSRFGAPIRFRSSRKPKKQSVLGSGGGVISLPSSIDQLQSSTTTTVMIKNIRNQFKRSDLLRFLRNHCLEENQNQLGALQLDRSEISRFDFVYLPMDLNQFWYKNRIVNLSTALAAFKFYQRFHNWEWPVNRNNKICQVTCAKIQGTDALRANFQRKIFWCHTEEYLPVVVAPACDGSTRPKVIPVGKCANKPHS